MGVLPKWSLLLVASGLLDQQSHWAQAVQPDCRKSPELHTIVPLNGQEGLRHEDVIAFGGKGYDWVEKGSGLELEEDFEDDEDEVEDEDEDELLDLEEEEREKNETAGRRLGFDEEVHLSSWRGKGRSPKKKVRFLGDTWKFSVKHRNWSRVETSEAPAGRWKPGSTVFGSHRSIVLFGGCTTTKAVGVKNDLWVFRLKTTIPPTGTWRQVQTTNPPQARRGHITVANETHLVVLGGKGRVWQEKAGKGGKGRMKTSVLADLWALPLSALEEGAPPGTWVRGAPFSGTPRWGASGTLMLQGSRQVLALFGGRHKNVGFKTHQASAAAYTYYNELWLYDFADDKWLLAPAAGDLPHARDHHGATSLDGKLFVFSGRTSEVAIASSVLNDLWSYDLGRGEWTRHDPGADGEAPLPRYMPGVSAVQPGNEIYPDGSVIVFAGEHLPGSTKRTTTNGVWVYRLDGAAWEKLSASDCSPEATGIRYAAKLETTRIDPLGAFAALAIVALLVLWYFALPARPAAAAESADVGEPYLRLN